MVGCLYFLLLNTYISEYLLICQGRKYKKALVFARMYLYSDYLVSFWKLLFPHICGLQFLNKKLKAADICLFLKRCKDDLRVFKIKRDTEIFQEIGAEDP